MRIMWDIHNFKESLNLENYTKFEIGGSRRIFKRQLILRTSQNLGQRGPAGFFYLQDVIYV